MPELLYRDAEQPLNLVLVAVVSLHDYRSAPVSLDFFARLIRAVLVFEVIDDHIGTLARELNRRRMPDARVRAGYQRDLLFQSSHAYSFGLCWLAP